MLTLGCALVVGASAKPGCGSSQTTSPDGSITYGSSCADTIVITSPLVEKVYAGDGDDVVYATPKVEEVYGGAGDDVIYGDAAEGGGGFAYEPSEPAPEYVPARGVRATTSNKVECPTSPCYGGDGSQEMFGGPGGDVLFGQRGNDTLHGEDGPDVLYGGIGDDVIFGNAGFDLLGGGLGTDTLDGNNDGDVVRGDGTVDVLKDTGGGADDTLSFATAVAPGFRGTIPIPGFPAEGNGEERGVYIRMDGNPAPCGVQSCNNDARYGGGGDEIEVSGFETVIGSPFADYYVGSDGNDRFYGGGGADVMLGNGGNDVLIGGADGDFIRGDAGTDTAFSSGGTNNCSADVEYRNHCAGTAEEVHQRDRSKISVGFATLTGFRGLARWEPYYLVGSQGADNVDVRFVESGTPSYIIFTAQPGSAEFDTSADVNHGSCEYKPAEVKCAVHYLSSHLDSLTLAGMGGDDRLNIAGNQTELEGTVTPVLLGGQGNDVLIGSGLTEDVLVDGDGVGNDTLYGHGFDDALVNNEGADNLQAGPGSDLLLSADTCGGDTLQGADGKKGDKEDVNNASWSQLPASSGGVVADLRRGTAGSQYAEVIISSATVSAAGGNGKGKGGGKGGGGKGNGKGGAEGFPSCATGSLDHVRNIDDLEGSSQADAFYGDGRDNNLLGRKGEDRLFARGGEDRIAAQDGEHDDIGGGAGKDLCIFDEGLDTLESCNP